MKRKRGYIPNGTAPIIALGLAALYMLFSVGIIKATHSCMGREASVAYFTSESKKCPCSQFASGNDHCCDDTQDLLKLNLSQKNVSHFQLSFPGMSFLGEVYNAISVFQNHSLAIFRPDTDETQPPPRVLYKEHCSFVFYDTDAVA